MNPSLEDNPSASGPMCWMLQNPLLLPKPVPSKGKLNLYSLTEAESEEVRRQLPGLQPQQLTSEGQAWATAYHASRSDLVAARADSYFELGKYDDAIRHYDEMLRLQPNAPMVLVARATARLNGHRDAAAAIRDCTAAIKENPDWAYSYLIRREAYRLLKDDKNAQADRQRAAGLDPEMVANWEDADWD